MFSKKVMGHRIITEKKEAPVFGVKFKNYGSHLENYKYVPYLNIACAIGAEKKEIDQFFGKLDEAVKEIRKKENKLKIRRIQEIKEGKNKQEEK